MIQQTNLSFLQYFLSFSCQDNEEREREQKDGKGRAEMETELREGGHKAERLNLCALAIAFQCRSEKASGTCDSVTGNEWTRETKY